MGKKHKSQSKADATVSAEPSTSGPSIFAGGQDAVDPLLASLFEKSSGPVKAPQFLSGQSTISRTDEVSSAQPRGKAEAQNGVALEDGETSLDSGKEEESSASDDDAVMEDAEEDVSIDGHKGTEATELAKESTEPEKPRKRKRTAEDDVEGAYMKRIAKEQAKEEEKQLQEKKKRRKIVEKDYSRDDAAGSGSDGEAEASSSEDEALPVHETISGEKDTEARDASVRTVFVGNVSTDAIKSKSAKKQLLAHLASFFATLPESSVPHKVESIRFRSTAFSSTAVPKRASFAKRELMDSTTRSTNAYVVYSTETAARKASLALNGSVVLDRHLRVDSVSHPAPVDHKRCVFVGNLDFVDEEPSNPDEDDKKKKKKPSAPADVEEGLWRTFNQHTRAGIKSTKGPVESVRVIRDASTRVSKGFAYVQFHNENSVEAALLLDGQKFPPLLPRKLRVVRAKRIAKQPAKGSGNPNKQPLGTSKEASLQGRASRLLGRAGAARLRASKSDSSTPLVFEGHRATADKSGIALRTKSRGAQGKVKAKGKPKTRSTRRAAAYRAVGGKPMGKMKASKQK